MRRDRFAHPLFRHNGCTVPAATLQPQLPDAREVTRFEIETTFGIDGPRRRALPLPVGNAEWRKEVTRGVLLDVHAGGAEEDVREQRALTAAVVELGAGLTHHGAIDGELDPVRAGLECAGRVVRIAVRNAFVPVEAARHREQVTNGDAPLAIIQVRDRRGVPILENRRVDIREIPTRDGGTNDRRGHRFGHGLQRVQCAPPVGGVPPRVEIVERARGVVRVVERRRRAQRVAVNAVVVACVRLVHHDGAATDDEHAIDVAVLPRRDFGVQAIEHGGVEADLLWRGGGPRERLGLSAQRRGHEQRERGGGEGETGHGGECTGGAGWLLFALSGCTSTAVRV